MGFLKAKYWHYHESQCKKKYKLDHIIAPDEVCPKCGLHFCRRVKVTCHGCNTVYYNDVSHPIDYKHVCPINREQVTTIKSETLPPSDKPQADRQFGLASAYFIGGAVAITGLCWVIKQVILLISWFVELLCWVITLLVELLQLIISLIIGFIIAVVALIVASLPYLLWGFTALVGLTLLAMLVHYILAKPMEFPAELNRVLQQLDTLPEHSRINKAQVKTAIQRSRRTIPEQQIIIGALFIGMVVGAYWGYLTSQTFEEVRVVVQKTVQLGSSDIIIFAIIYFGGKYFFQLPEELAINFNPTKGIRLSLIFGVATVLTTLFLPPLLEEQVLMGLIIAIQLTINIIMDIIFATYESLASVLWRAIKTGRRKIAVAGIQFWDWLNYRL